MIRLKDGGGIQICLSAMAAPCRLYLIIKMPVLDSNTA